MASKSAQPNRYRKGKDLQVGDMIAVRWEGKRPVEFSPIESYEGKVPYMGVTNYSFTLANGRTKLYGGGEFAEGHFA